MAVASKAQVIVDPDVQSRLDQYIGYTNDAKWDEAFDMVYPKLFTKVTKQDLVDMMVGMQADGMNLHMDNTRVISVTTPVEEGNETFLRLDYVSDLTVTIEKGGIFDAPKAIQAIDEQFKAAYGRPNVKWNEDERIFAIRAHKAMMAIHNGNRDWKFVEINMDQPELMEYLFSPSIMDALVRVE
jgi:hypothetical protein